MINPSIVRLVLNKHETEVEDLLNKFKVRWRIRFRDGVEVDNLSNDRDDNRYNLIIKDNHVERVIGG